MTLIVSTIVLASSVQNLFGQNPVVSFKSTKNVVCPGTATNFINNSYPVAPATSIVSFKFTFGGSANPAVDTARWNPTGVMFNGSMCGQIGLTLEVVDNLGQRSTGSTTIIVPCYYNTPQINPQNTKTLCVGDSVVLSMNAGFTGTYQWTLNNIDITGATDSTYIVKGDGYYGCSVVDANNCSWTSYRYVQYNQTLNPRIQIWGNKNGGNSSTIKNGDIVKLCLGDVLTGSAQINWFNTNQTITWSNGSTGQQTKIDSVGTYSYTVSANGCSEQSDTFTVVMLQLPIPIVTAPLKSVYCNGDTMPVLKLMNNGYTNIAWGIGGQYYNWNISLVDSFIIASSGTYGVMVTDANGCSDTSGLFKVTFNPSPNQPIISPDQYQPGCHVWCDNFPGCTYQWLLNDAALVGENTQYMDVSKYGSGFYKVEVTNSSGCSSLSDPNYANCTATGLEFRDKKYQQATLSQNPASGSVTVNTPERSEIFLISTSGRVILSAQGTEVLFDLQDVPAGLYFVKTISKDGTSAQKLLVQQ